MNVEIDYTNYRGERSIRVIRPVRVFFGMNKWHADDQWLLEAAEKDKGIRYFAMKDIHSWKPAD